MEELVLDDLLENEAFVNGIAVGINLHQSRVIAAHERKEPLAIGDRIFYLEDGRERLGRILNEICKWNNCAYDKYPSENIIYVMGICWVMLGILSCVMFCSVLLC